MLVDTSDRLTGLFTDSDLARLIEARHDDALDRPVNEVMIKAPTTIYAGTKMSVAVEVLADRKISELPIIDAAGKPVGMIDVTDVVSMLPEATPAKPMKKQPRASIRIYDADEYSD